MTLEERLGHPVQDHDEPIIGQHSRCEISLPENEPVEPSSSSRLAWSTLAVVALVAGLLAGWLLSGATQPQPEEADPPPSGVAGTAELFTALYLTGTSGEAMARVFAGDPPPPGGTWVNHSAAVAIDRLDADVWEVTVAVDALQLHNGRYEPVPLEFYLVPVAMSGDRAVALAAPARVPAPATPARAQRTLAVVPDDRAAVAQEFIELHLQADPRARQLLANPAAVTAFATPPYTSVVAEAVGVDTLGRATVTAQATTANGVTHYLEYLVTLAEHESGWRVVDVGSAGR